MLKKRVIVMAIIAVALMALNVSVISAPAGKKFETVSADKVLVTASRLNVRTGPGTNYPTVKVLNRGEVVDTIGMLGEWYVVHLSDDSIGVVFSKHVAVSSVKTDEAAEEETVPVFNNSASNDEEMLLRLINGERVKNNLVPYSIDGGLNELARKKAEDMVKNNYFSHVSPVYGSPFEMLKGFGITYKSAGENIAGNKTVSGAHTQIMNSPFHRCNILNSGFNRIGIAAVEHEKYGKVIVQLFTEQ